MPSGGGTRRSVLRTTEATREGRSPAGSKMLENAVGKDPSLTLSFVEKVRDLEDLVVVMNEEELTLAFVGFGWNEEPIPSESR